MNTSYRLKSLLYYYTIVGTFCMQLYAYKPVGLKALGNSCYMNSLIQILASIQPITAALSTLPVKYYQNNADNFGQIILDGTNNSEGSKNSDLEDLPQKIDLADATINVIQSIQLEQNSKKYNLVTSQQMWEVLKPIMRKRTGRQEGSQEDTAEAWVAVIDALCLSPAIKNILYNSLNIEGTDHHTIMEYSLSLNFENPNKKNLPLKNLNTLEKCLQYTVENRGLLEEISSYFVVNIPRVHYIEHTGETFKDISAVQIPDYINLQYFVRPKKTADKTRWYHVHAIACHHGPGNDSGHYIAYIRGEDGWYHCNDSVITKIENQANMLKEVPQRVYLIVYKQGLAPAFKKAQSPQKDVSKAPRRAKGLLYQSLQTLKQAFEALAVVLKKS